MKNKCHRPGCNAEVAPRLVACSGHWFELPRNLRDAIWATYRRGQEIDKNPSAEYLDAADRCQEFWKAKDAARLSSRGAGKGEK